MLADDVKANLRNTMMPSFSRVDALFQLLSSLSKDGISNQAQASN